MAALCDEAVKVLPGDASEDEWASVMKVRHDCCFNLVTYMYCNLIIAHGRLLRGHTYILLPRRT